jgi:hypothetical protein
VTRLLLFAAVLVALVATPTTAWGANSAVYDDTVNDAVYPGVDIHRLALVYTDTGFVGIGVSTNLLIGGNRIAVYIDADRNPATGSTGADYALFYEQYITGQGLSYWFWNGSAWQLGAPSTLGYEPGERGVTMVIHASEIGSPAVGVNVFARGGHADSIGTGDSYWDTAPNVGALPLLFAPPSAVGGTGGPAPAPAPVAALSFSEARSAIRRGLRKRVGRGATIGLRRCVRKSAARVRCTAAARRGNVSWKGRATVVEVAAGDGSARSFAFRGSRVDRGCLRGAAPRSRCIRPLRW